MFTHISVLKLDPKMSVYAKDIYYQSCHCQC